MEDTKGALAAIKPDPRVEGQWYATKWMYQEKPETALITLTKTERDGHTGYIFKSTDPKQQEGIESLWAMDFDGTHFFVSKFPEKDCTDCMVLFYQMRQQLIYVYVLNIEKSEEFLKNYYTGMTELSMTGDMIKEISVTTLDDKSKEILKDMAQHAELWENAVIFKKKP